MPATSKLVLEFNTGDGGTTTHSYKYINPEITTARVKTIMNTTISNGSIFEKVPVSIKAAKVVTTTESDFDLSD